MRSKDITEWGKIIVKKKIKRMKKNRGENFNFLSTLFRNKDFISQESSIPSLPIKLWSLKKTVYITKNKTLVSMRFFKDVYPADFSGKLEKSSWLVLEIETDFSRKIKTPDWCIYSTSADLEC